MEGVLQGENHNVLKIRHTTPWKRPMRAIRHTAVISKSSHIPEMIGGSQRVHELSSKRQRSHRVCRLLCSSRLRPLSSYNIPVSYNMTTSSWSPNSLSISRKLRDIISRTTQSSAQRFPWLHRLSYMPCSTAACCLPSPFFLRIS